MVWLTSKPSGRKPGAETTARLMAGVRHPAEILHTGMKIIERQTVIIKAWTRFMQALMKITEPLMRVTESLMKIIKG